MSALRSLRGPRLVVSLVLLFCSGTDLMLNSIGLYNTPAFQSIRLLLRFTGVALLLSLLLLWGVEGLVDAFGRNRARDLLRTCLPGQLWRQYRHSRVVTVETRRGTVRLKQWIGCEGVGVTLYCKNGERRTLCIAPVLYLPAEDRLLAYYLWLKADPNGFFDEAVGEVR